MKNSTEIKYATPLDAKLFNLNKGALTVGEVNFLKPVKEVTLYGPKGPVRVMLARIYPSYKYLVTARSGEEEPMTLFCGKLTQANQQFVNYCQ